MTAHNRQDETFAPLPEKIEREQPKPADKPKPEQIRPGIVRDPLTGKLGTNIPKPPNQ